MKANNVFRVMTAAFLVIAFTVSIISCKEAPVEEQPEEKPAVEVPAETIPEETPPPEEETSIESNLETVLKEKVSFISEALPGAELDTKTGELTAKAGNKWGVEAGETIGWYVVNAYKEKTADGVEKEKDAIGLIPKVAKFEQEKLYEETGEYLIPFPINLKESSGVKITEMKIIEPTFLSSAMVLGINILPGTKIYVPFGGKWDSSFEDFYTKEKTDDKNFYTYYNINDLTDIFYQINFKEGKVIPEIKNTEKIESASNNEEIVINSHEVKFGDPIIDITGEAFLDMAANKLSDRITYENPGNYQATIIAIIRTLNFQDENKEPEVKHKPLEFLKVGQGKEQKTVFIFDSFKEAAHEQTN